MPLFARLGGLTTVCVAKREKRFAGFPIISA